MFLRSSQAVPARVEEGRPPAGGQVVEVHACPLLICGHPVVGLRAAEGERRLELVRVLGAKETTKLLTQHQ